MEKNELLLPEEIIMSKIYFIRGQKVMLDRIWHFYMKLKRNKRQVKRNIARFPADFMFELTEQENNSLRSQFGTLKKGEHSKFLPYVFTEYGVLMLSSVLSSNKAIQVSIQIIRIFTKIRQALIDNTELRLAIEEIKLKTDNTTKNIEVVFQYFDELLDKKEKPDPPMKKIGYKTY